MINRYKTGIPLHISINLCPNKSVNPPKKPWTEPKITPIIEEKKVNSTPKIIEILKPYISLASTSLAWSSVPKRFEKFGGEGAGSCKL